ncbi:GntR family transcriptional regulator [Protaetiibacter sp. SSC-01]|uniref:GntR family transcriptional regulator n=1 Tax=Protaetiibacter sp. SSC-01 TaxID=2759943 RepID=UPI0016574FA1|nr:GntR family transcriptional regulator [Protaetiibacter sp. SSC-01]QNO37613.1 GntR family transcriptional regulator [Protaetiibacter sp. SSC-01]
MPIPSDRARVDRTLLRDDVLGTLRAAIIDGTFAPGEQLRDGELAEWLGCSRTPVREALLQLARSGLVIARPGRSTVVSTLDLERVREARDVVASMHALAVRTAVPLLASDDIAEMRAANDAFEAAIAAHDTDAALAADERLHGVPVRVAGNRILETVLDQFAPLIERAVRLRFDSPEGWGSLARHAELIDLIEAGDAEAAAALAQETWSSLFPGENPDDEGSRTPH